MDNETITMKSQLRISLPIAFERLINILMTLVDTLVIALVGTKELAALGAMTVIIDLMQMSIQTVNVSNNTLVAKCIGENNIEKEKLTIGNSIILTIGISIITMVVIAFIQPVFPSLFKVDKIAITYLTIRLFGFIQNGLVTVLSGYHRTIGNQKNILRLRVFAVLLNLILDVIAVTHGYGIVGVALATVIIETLLAIYLILYSWGKVKMKLVKECYLDVVRLFKWNFFERIISKIDNFAFNLIVARMGNLEYAVHIILLQISTIYESFTQGFGDGITISVGIASGKKDENNMIKVRNVSNKLIRYISFILPGIIMMISFVIMHLSLKDRELQNIFLIVSPLFLIGCYIITSATYYFSVLRGLRDFKFLANRNLISSIIKIVVSLLLSITPLGIVGVWMGYLMYGISQKHLSKMRYKKISVTE